MLTLPYQERKQILPIIEMLPKGCSNLKNSINLFESGERKKYNCVSLIRLLYRVSVFKRNTIIVPRVIICSFYQCILVGLLIYFEF